MSFEANFGKQLSILTLMLAALPLSLRLDLLLNSGHTVGAVTTVAAAATATAATLLLLH